MGVCAIFKPSGKNGQCQQWPHFFKIDLAFLASGSCLGLPRMISMLRVNCWQGLPNAFMAQLTVGS